MTDEQTKRIEELEQQVKSLTADNNRRAELIGQFQNGYVSKFAQPEFENEKVL